MIDLTRFASIRKRRCSSVKASVVGVFVWIVAMVTVLGGLGALVKVLL